MPLYADKPRLAQFLDVMRHGGRHDSQFTAQFAHTGTHFVIRSEVLAAATGHKAQENPQAMRITQRPENVRQTVKFFISNIRHISKYNTADGRRQDKFLQFCKDSSCHLLDSRRGRLKSFI